MAKDIFGEAFINALLNQCQKMKDNGKTDDEIKRKVDELDITQIYEDTLEQTATENVNNIKEDMSSAYENYLSNVNIFTKDIAQKWGKCFEISYMMYVVTLEAMDRYCKYCSELEKENPQNVDGKVYLFTSLKEICARACQEYLEIFTLVRCGFADGAYARCRSIDELSVIAQFIYENGEATAKSYYMASFTDDKYNWAKTASCFTAKQKAPKNNLNFTDIRLKCKNIPPKWVVHYNALNQAVHASPQGTFGRLGIQEGSFSLGVGHSAYGIEQPAVHAAISLYMISHLFFSLFTTGDVLIMQKGISKWYHLLKETYDSTAKKLDNHK